MDILEGVTGELQRAFQTGKGHDWCLSVRVSVL